MNQNFDVQYFINRNSYLKKLSGLKVTPLTSVFASIQPTSVFTSIQEMKLPLVISGRLITADTYKDMNYGKVILSPEDLKASVDSWVGIQIYKHHGVHEKIRRGEDVSVDEVVGRITRVVWNDKDGGIDFDAEIMDQQIAYKMLKGLIKYVSVGFGRDIINVDGTYYFKHLVPKETSLVYDPRDKRAVFAPKTE